MVNDAQKKALLLHTVGIKVQELIDTLTDPRPGAGVERDTATKFQKPLRTLNAYFPTKLINESYERHVFRNMVQQKGETFDQFIAKLRKQAGIAILPIQIPTSEIKSSINADRQP